MKRYFQGGRRDALSIKSTIQRYYPIEYGTRILDFAAGYGRVVRFLATELPDCTVAAADIHTQAVDFMTEHFTNIEVHPSTRDPKDLDIGEPYNFIYVLSLFSHLPPESFSDWLSML